MTYLTCDCSSFSHFDPNGSGSVHYGEFLWAFFNRRNLVRKWKRSTEKLTKAQILQRFHMFDINGNGILSVKEFRKALESFDIKLNDVELETLISKFDVNGDGEISVPEFKQFVDQAAPSA